MSTFAYAQAADWQRHLPTTSPEVVFAPLIAQLQQQFEPALLDTALITSLPKDVLLEHHVLPLAFFNDMLYCGTVDFHPDLPDKLQQTFSCPVGLYLIPETVFRPFAHWLAKDSSTVLPETGNAFDPSVSEVFQDLLARAQGLRASDIHLEPQADHTMLVRFRVDGLLHDIQTLSSAEFPYSTRLVSKIKVAANLDIAETRVPQDGRITETIHGEPVDLRVSTLPSMHGEKVVIRLLPHKNPFQELRDLGLEGEALITYYNWIKKPQGMILITGQTGSGKTSTLYTTLSHILHSEKNIVTIEDPIEYQLKGVTQVQVHPKVGLTFANGLRSILRQDPDTILLGEIRDAETAEIAYQAALTGHMVLSTLHTNDAPSAIIRLLDIQVEPYLIASATLGVVAQRLLRKICPHCAQAYTPGQDLIRSLGLNPKKEHQFFRAIGCEQCFQTGYYGREGIFEVMPVDEHLAELIGKKESLGSIRSHLQSQKIQSLFDSALQKVERGLTTVEEIYRVVPPTQHQVGQSQRKNAASGSVFVFMLFLLSILSVLIVNASSFFEGNIGLLRVQKQALQGTYVTQAALNLGEEHLHEKLSVNRLYLFPKTPNSQSPDFDPLIHVQALQEIFQRPQTIRLSDAPFEGAYQVLAKPLKTALPGLLEYNYHISGKTLSQKQVSPAQMLSGKFQVETGPLPLSFFECFSTAGSISVSEKAQGPFYSPQKPKTDVWPVLGYYSNEELPLSLPASVWPSIGDATADQALSPARPSVFLTPVSSAQGASFPLAEVQPGPDTFELNTTPWAIVVYGNVDYLLLNAPSPDTQTIEINQLLATPGTPDGNGYQRLSVLKTIISVDKRSQRAEITTQNWQWTVNPQKALTQQRLIKTINHRSRDRFSGLILVNGGIHALMSAEPDGQSAYNRPLTIFATNDIALPSALRKQATNPNAVLGIVTTEGQIAFQAHQKPVLAIWNRPKTSSQHIEAALVAPRYALAEEQHVEVYGSVAALQGEYPARLHTQADPALHSLIQSPPFFPMATSDSLALLVRKAPYDTHWSEVRNQ